MAELPTQRFGESMTALGQSRKVEDIYNSIGQPINRALGDFSMVDPTDRPGRGGGLHFSASRVPSST
jgi:hypothetical protein